MTVKQFLKDKLVTIALLTFGIATIEMFLSIYPIENFIKLYIPIILFVLYGISLIIEYLRKKRFYQKIFYLLDELEQKYLIVELIENTSFAEGKILKEILEQTSKSMLENVNQYQYVAKDYKEYIEIWIHEVKLPLAASKLMIENNKNEVTKSIKEELEKIENYIEQALFYARSSTVEKDYYIKKILLKEIVNECIRKNKNILMQEKITIKIHDLDVMVNSDNKWILFILNQVLQNSVKYKKQEGNLEIEIYAVEKKESVILWIKDNGMGIKKGEITRVFEKGFTGTNGRILGRKSTGIGLYLCKKLCQKLGVAIELNSIQEEGTEVRIVFPKNSYTNL